MANTISSDLIQDVVYNTANAVAKKRLKGFKSCISDFSADVNPIRNGKPVNAQISLATASGETKTNPTSFESTGDTVSAKEVPVSLYSQQFGVEWNSGVQIEQVLTSNMNKLCDKLVGVWSALLTTTNFGASNDFDIAGASSSDAKDELFQQIYALLDKGSQKFLVACSSLYAKGAPVNLSSFDPTMGGMVRGFDGFFENAYLNTGDVKGVVTDGTGIALVSRLPEWYGGVRELLSTQDIAIDDLGISVQYNTWGSAASRTEYGTLDVVFGAGVYDASATKLIGQTA